MKTIGYMLLSAIGLAACDEEMLFKTVEAPAPIVTATNWRATALDEDGNEVATTGFAEGGRLFRLPSPLNDTTSTTYRDIRFQAELASGNQRTIDSVTIEYSWIPSFPSNAPQPWTVYDGIAIAEDSRATTYSFSYLLNLDEWMDDYVCFNYITGVPGGCGITDWQGVGALFGLNVVREDNMMRLTLHFSDGSFETIAQVQFSYPLDASAVHM